MKGINTEKTEKEALVLLMKKLSIDLEIYIEKSLRHRDISGSQVCLLVYLLRHHPKGTCITELCCETGISKATVSIAVKKLKEKGYLRTLEDPKDIRIKKVMPTKKLMDESRELIKGVQGMEDHIYKAFNEAEWKQLKNVECRLLNQLGRGEYNGRTQNENSFSTIETI